MDYPARTKQQQAESTSYAILLYKLRNVGIFRNVTENDYGIDFEIEFVIKGRLLGRYIKAQVKSAETLKIRSSDHVPTVSGIKQSTLAYWCELSLRTHVIAYAVDLTSEKIYISRPLFWQSTKLIDGTHKSKTISFLPEKNEIDQTTAVEAITIFHSITPRLPEVLYALSTSMRYMRQFLEMYIEVFHYDPQSDLPEPDVFRAFLETCKILTSHRINKLEISEDDKRHMFSYSHWARKLYEYSDDVSCIAAQTPLKILMPILIDELHSYRKIIQDGAYYWSYTNPQFAELVHDTPLPQQTDAETLEKWGYEYSSIARPPRKNVRDFMREARNYAEIEREKEEAKKEEKRKTKEA